MQFQEINWFLMGIVGDVEQRPRLIAGTIVDEVLFPEVSGPVCPCSMIITIHAGDDLLDC